MNVERRLKELNYELPEMSPPKAMYIPVKQIGNALFVSGQIPMLDGKLLYSGKAGDKRTLEEAQDAATEETPSEEPKPKKPRATKTKKAEDAE